MLPIPGTANIAHLEENMAAEKLQLSPNEWKQIEGLGRPHGIL
jgi:aryl-alcohol dehydrogenase-like predicted oxidoreductase